MAPRRRDGGSGWVLESLGVLLFLSSFFLALLCGRNDADQGRGGCLDINRPINGNQGRQWESEAHCKRVEKESHSAVKRDRALLIVDRLGIN